MESNQSEVYVQVSALQSGHLTLPDRFFTHPASETARRTVPSLSFLIEHTNPQTKRITRLLFDLGLRNPTSNYPIPIQNHIQNRQPLTTEPDVVQSLSKGGLSPSDIDYVIYSHIHWDHIGDPKAFNTSTFVVGPGNSSLLDGSETRLRGGHSFFESDLFPSDRTIEITYSTENPKPDSMIPSFCPAWKEYGILPRAIDIFHDGSVLLVDAPGHLPGHLNILARVEKGKFVYLAGDACHDRRLLRGEKSISEWLDEGGHVCCIHIDKAEAEKTIEIVRSLEEQGVEGFYEDAEEIDNQDKLLCISDLNGSDGL